MNTSEKIRAELTALLAQKAELQFQIDRAYAMLQGAILAEQFEAASHEITEATK